jgi:AraC-like DNA-binding protein
VEGASKSSAAALRTLLRTRGGNLPLEDAAKLLHRSPRSLQRELVAVGSSFRAEQIQARLTAAQELLSSTGDKLAVVAGQLGLSEQGLNRLFRERVGVTPEAWRRRLRSR